VHWHGERQYQTLQPHGIDASQLQGKNLGWQCKKYKNNAFAKKTMSANDVSAYPQGSELLLVHDRSAFSEIGLQK
jgi:hypothetical protein